MPNSRSDGAWSVGAARTVMRMPAAAAMTTASTARPANAHHRGNCQERPGNRPPADVTHVHRPSAMSGKRVQRAQTQGLRQFQDEKAGKKTAPPKGGKRRHPQREIETNLK